MEKNNDLMAGKGEKGKWITVNGSHIYVEDGQSVEDAMNKQFSKRQKHSEAQSSKPHSLSDSDKQILDDAIYWAKKAGKGNVKGAFEQLDEDMKGFLSYGENGNYESVLAYFREQLWDKDPKEEMGENKTSPNQDSEVKTKKIHLQSIGERNAVEASNIKVGDEMIWNFGWKEKVLDITPSKSGQSLTMKIKDMQSGKTLTRTLRAKSLVALTRFN